MSMKKNWKLKELIESLEKAYCSKMAVEYTHIPNEEEVSWLRDRIELSALEELSQSEKVYHYSRLQWAHQF